MNVFLQINGEYYNFSTIGVIIYQPQDLTISYQTEGGRWIREMFDSMEEFNNKKQEIESIGA